MNKHIVLMILLYMFSSISYADAPAEADVVNLRSNCTEGTVTVTNCFTTVTALENWINNTRTSNNPLLINIGPGTFGGISCNFSDVTYRGAGRDNTIIHGLNYGPGFLTNAGCNNINVENLKIIGAVWAVKIENTEELNSTWTNVEILGGDYAWIEIDAPCKGETRGNHRIFSSRLTAGNSQNIPSLPASVFKTANVYGASCGKTWIYNSELTAISAVSPSNAYVINAVHDSEVHVYGSNLRLIYESFSNSEINFSLIFSKDGSEVHIHGTGIDVISEMENTINVLNAESGSSIHANESAYAIKNPGQTTRISGNGIIMAPYQWHQSTQPPSIISVSGADMYIETDCPITGHCSVGGIIPHTMIYLEACSGNGTGPNNGPWFDTVTNECRQ